jgi:hypothetical protein
MNQPSRSAQGVFFQAAVKFVQSHLKGTIRLIVPPGQPQGESLRLACSSVPADPY